MAAPTPAAQEGERKPTEEEFDFGAYRYLPHATGDCDTLIHILRATIGAGVLAMPWAYKFVGLYLGVSLSIVLGILSTVGTHFLIKASHVIYTRLKIPSLEYNALVEVSFGFGPGKFRQIRRSFKTMADWVILFTVFCVASVYIVIIAANLKQFSDFKLRKSLELRLYILMITPFLLPWAFLKNLKWMSPISLVSNLAMCITLAVAMAFCSVESQESSEPDTFVDAYLHWPVTVGVIIFAYSATGAIMHLENNLDTPIHMVGMPSITFYAMIIIVITNTWVGWAGYNKYGEHTLSAVTLNLPIHKELGQASKLLAAITLYCSYPLQIYIANSIILRTLRRKVKRGTFMEKFVRFAMVLCTVIVAMLIPMIGFPIGFIGATGFSLITFVFPGLIIFAVYGNKEEEPGYGGGSFRFLIGLVLLIVGIIVFLIGFPLTTFWTVARYSLTNGTAYIDK